MTWGASTDRDDDREARDTAVAPPGASSQRWKIAAIATAAIVAVGAIAVFGSGTGDGTDDAAADEPPDDATPTTLGTLPPSTDADTEPDEAADVEPEDDESSDDADDPSDEDAAAGTDAGTGTVDRTTTSSDEIIDLPDALASVTSPYEVVLVDDDKNAIRTLSLPSGRVRSTPFDSPGANGPQARVVAGDQASLVMTFGRNAFLLPRIGPLTEVDLGVEVGGTFDGASPAGVVETPTGTEFIVDGWDNSSGENIRIRVGADGAVTSSEPRPFNNLTPLTTGGSIVSDAGGVYLVDDDGAARRLTTGQILTLNEPWMLVRECDEAYRCGVAAQSLIGDDRIEYASTETLADLNRPFGFGALINLSPDGTRLSIVPFEDGPTTTQTIVWSDGTTHAFELNGRPWETTVAWTPDGSGMFVSRPNHALLYVTANGEATELADFARVSGLDIRPVDAEILRPIESPSIRADLSGPVDVDLVGVDGDAMVHLRLGVAPKVDGAVPPEITAWTAPDVGRRPDLLVVDGEVIAVAGEGEVVYRSEYGRVVEDLDGQQIPSERYLGADGVSMWRTSADETAFELVPIPFVGGDVPDPLGEVLVERASVFGSDGAGGLVYELGGDVFVTTSESTERITSGQLVAIGPTVAFVHECDDAGVCSNRRVNRPSGNSPTELAGPPGAAVPMTPTRPIGSDGTVSPDGGVLFAELPENMTDDGSAYAGSPWAFVDFGDSSTTLVPRPDTGQPIMWSQSSQFAFFLVDRRIHVYDRATNQIVRLAAAGAFDAITTVPREFAADAAAS
ncbi:MAG: hypothetical protein AAFP84_07875 [Actinomycetota bacterium]